MINYNSNQIFHVSFFITIKTKIKSRDFQINNWFSKFFISCVITYCFRTVLKLSSILDANLIRNNFFFKMLKYTIKNARNNYTPYNRQPIRGHLLDTAGGIVTSGIFARRLLGQGGNTISQTWEGLVDSSALFKTISGGSSAFSTLTR